MCFTNFFLQMSTANSFDRISDWGLSYTTWSTIEMLCLVGAGYFTWPILQSEFAEVKTFVNERKRTRKENPGVKITQL